MNLYYEFRDVGIKGDDNYLLFLKVFQDDALEKFSRHAMFWACRYGHSKSVSFLIDKNFDFHFEEEICLKWSCENGHFETTKLLVDNGANIHAKDDYALSIACRCNHYSIVKLLLENGATVDTWENQPLLWSSQKGNKQISKLLIEYGAKPTQDAIISFLCFNEDIDSLKLFVKNGTSIKELKKTVIGEGRPYTATALENLIRNENLLL